AASGRSRGHRQDGVPRDGHRQPRSYGPRRPAVQPDARRGTDSGHLLRAGANHFCGGSTTSLIGRDGRGTSVFGLVAALGSLVNGTWAWVCNVSTYSPGLALGCTSIVVVASVLSAGIDRVPVLIGPGKASGVTFTGDLKSGQSRWHWSFSSTFFPASTSTRSSVGATWNGAVSRMATTSCRLGRLELSWVLVD